MHWYVIYTKPRQELRALLNLEQQGYKCYLPQIPTARLRHGPLTVILEPLFARYLFVQLYTGHSGQSWAPIRSTQGVSRMVAFGAEPAKVCTDLIETLRTQVGIRAEEPARLIERGERVRVRHGPFAGLDAVYQMIDGEHRAMVLIELLGKLSKLRLDPASLELTGDDASKI